MLFLIIRSRYRSLVGVKTDYAQFYVRTPADPVGTISRNGQITEIDTFWIFRCNILCTDRTLLMNWCEIRRTNLAVKINEFDGGHRFVDSTRLDSTPLNSWQIRRTDLLTDSLFTSRYFNFHSTLVLERECFFDVHEPRVTSSFRLIDRCP